MKKITCFIINMVLTLMVMHTIVQAQTYEKQRFNISGFCEVMYRHLDLAEDSETNIIKQTIPNKDHFVLNNLNIYMNFNVDKHWIFFTEIQYLFFPTGKTNSTMNTDANGSPTGITYTPFDNYYSGENNINLQYGTIIIERAYLEWNRIPYANIRAGRYFTPYGIWSQDHGAPVLTGTRVPLVTSPSGKGSGIPASQTGLELVGKVDIPFFDMLLDYAAYVGNGVSESDSIGDENDENKAVGGFFNYKSTFADFIDLDIGASCYRGERSILHSQDAVITIPDDIVSAPDGSYALLPHYPSSGKKYLYKQMDTIGAGHFTLAINELPFDGVFKIQGEYLKQWVKEDENETRLVNVLGLPRSPDKYQIEAYYLQVEYELFDILSPYARYDYIKTDTKDPNMTYAFNELTFYFAGLGIKPTPRVVLKFEFVRGVLKVGKGLTIAGQKYDPNNDFDVYTASVSVAF